MAVSLIAATTDATTKSFRVEKSQVPVGLHQDGLSGVEVIDIMRSADGGTTFFDYKKGGNVQQLSIDDNSIAIDTPGIYKVDKPSTSAATLVSLSVDWDL